MVPLTEFRGGHTPIIADDFAWIVLDHKQPGLENTTKTTP